MSKLITSQHYLDDNIIAAKIEAGDYEVFVSPEFEVDGEIYRVILDGNHSFAAALQAGVAPEITEYSASDCDTVFLLGRSVEAFLQAAWMDGEYIFASTRKAVW